MERWQNKQNDFFCFFVFLAKSITILVKGEKALKTNIQQSE